MDLEERLPSGWVATRLGEIAQINPGLPNKDLSDDLQVSFLPMKAVEELSGKVDMSLTVDYAKVRKGYTPFINGDIIFAKITPCMENGKVAVVDNLKNGIGFGSTEFHVIRLHETIPRKFLFCYLIQQDFRIDAKRNMKGTAGQLRVPARYMKEVSMPFPPVNEQRRIVAKVESMFAESKTAREALDKTLFLLRRFRQSILFKAFRGDLTQRDPNDEPAEKLLQRIRQVKQIHILETNEDQPSVGLTELPETWAWVTIGDLETFIGSGITPRGGKKVYVNEGIPFIRSQNVYADGFHLENVAHVTRQMHEEMKRTQVHPNDVLLNITGASIGRSTYTPEGFGEANVNQHVCIIRTGWWMVPVYLSYFLNSTYGQDQIFATESGVTREGLNYKQVRSLRIPLAPLSEQKRVVAKIEEAFSLADQVEAAVKKAREKAEKIDQAILAKAFRGELVSQDPNDEPASVLLQHIKATKQYQKPKTVQQKIL